MQDFGSWRPCVSSGPLRLDYHKNKIPLTLISLIISFHIPLTGKNKNFLCITKSELHFVRNSSFYYMQNPKNPVKNKLILNKLLGLTETCDLNKPLPRNHLEPSLWIQRICQGCWCTWLKTSKKRFDISRKMSLQTVDKARNPGRCQILV